MASRRQRSRKALVSVTNSAGGSRQRKERSPEGDRPRRETVESLLLDLARVDFARPRPGRLRAALDELLESLEVVLDAARRDLRQLVTHLAAGGFRLVILDAELP